jgi:hypothetical protein
MNIIRKIIVGNDPLKAMAYYVGQKAGEAEVDCIVLDAEHLHRYKERRYLIYIKGEGWHYALESCREFTRTT